MEVAGLGIEYRAEEVEAEEVEVEVDVESELDVEPEFDVAPEPAVEPAGEVTVAVLVTETEELAAEASADAQAPTAVRPSRIDRALRTRLTRASRRCTDG